jgi:hypothetical protein
MDLVSALLIYIIILIGGTIIIYYAGIRLWSSFILSILMGQIVLNLIISPTKIDISNMGTTSDVALYALIQLVSPVLMLIYAITVAITDKRDKGIVVRISSPRCNRK